MITPQPLLDMANHTVDSSLECKVKWTSTSALQLSAPAKSHQPQGLSVGQEVMITYGPHSNGVRLSDTLDKGQPEADDITTCH